MFSRPGSPVGSPVHFAAFPSEPTPSHQTLVIDQFYQHGASVPVSASNSPQSDDGASRSIYSPVKDLCSDLAKLSTTTCFSILQENSRIKPTPTLMSIERNLPSVQTTQVVVALRNENRQDNHIIRQVPLPANQAILRRRGVHTSLPKLLRGPRGELMSVEAQAQTLPPLNSRQSSPVPFLPVSTTQNSQLFSRHRFMQQQLKISHINQKIVITKTCF